VFVVLRKLEETEPETLVAGVSAAEFMGENTLEEEDFDFVEMGVLAELVNFRLFEDGVREDDVSGSGTP